MPPTASHGALPPIKSLPACPTKDSGINAKENNQIHSYHKLFWRVNMTIEFNIFHHTDRNMYEIAAYNSEKDFEFVPLFLIDGVIKDMIMDHTTINTEIEKLKVKLSKDRFTHIPGHDDMIELAKVSLFNKFVESHLHPKFDGTLDFANLPGETFDLEATIFTPPPVVEEVFDEEENLITLQNARGTVDNKSEKIETTACNPTVAKSPVANKPLPPAEKVTKVQRKRASIAEFNHTLSILKKDSKSLKNANKMTENLLNLSEESVGAFKQALQRNAGTSKFYDKSTPIGKFRWAVHRIVLQQYIEAVKLRIDEMSSGAKKPMRINGTFPMPGSTDMYSAQNKVENYT